MLRRLERCGRHGAGSHGSRENRDPRYGTSSYVFYTAWKPHGTRSSLWNKFALEHVSLLLSGQPIPQHIMNAWAFIDPFQTQHIASLQDRRFLPVIAEYYIYCIDASVPNSTLTPPFRTLHIASLQDRRLLQPPRHDQCLPVF